MKFIEKFFLIYIICIAFMLRVYDLNWDRFYHLHPDERAISMFTLPLAFPKDLQTFLNPSSPLNPHFFAYGNFPLYLLKGASVIIGFINPAFVTYEKINLLGRFISAIADLGTLILIFLIARKIFGKKAALISAFIYSFSVFPIQASHFYAVDVLLTFFITLTIYQLLRFYEKPSMLNALLVGVFFGFSLSTKISAIPLIIAILFTILSDFMLIFIKQPHKLKTWFPHLPIALKKLIKEGLVVLGTLLFTFILLEPYALIDFKEFLKQNLLQSEMTKNPFIFPYTLQYVGKIPYLYEIKNLFMWGVGPVIGTLSILGLIYFIYLVFKKESKAKDAKQIILFVFFATYFLIVGKFAVGWMRYMLPLYPLFAIFSGLFIVNLVELKIENIKNKILKKSFYLIFYLLIILWPISFINIYTKPNTRITASNWILRNIKYGNRIAIEHWDDSLPLQNLEKYKPLTLELYNPDTQQKWEIINNQIKQTDYIIIASNRLYIPLQKLTDCKKLPQNYCYPETSKYYQKLFSGKLGFKKVAEFTSYPTIPLLNIPIDDQGADESFTVYDHPKILIYEKIYKK